MMNSVNSNYSLANAGKLLRSAGQSVSQKASSLGNRLVKFFTTLPTNIKEDRKIAISAFVVSNLVIFAIANGIIRKSCDRLTKDELKGKELNVKKHVLNVIFVGGIALTSNLILSRLMQVALSRIVLSAITTTHIVASYILNRDTTPTLEEDTASQTEPRENKKVDHPSSSATSIENDGNIGDEDIEGDEVDHPSERKDEARGIERDNEGDTERESSTNQTNRLATPIRQEEQAAKEQAEAARIAAEQAAKAQAEDEAAKQAEIEKLAKEQAEDEKLAATNQPATNQPPVKQVAAKAAPKVGAPAKAAPKAAAKQAAVQPAEEPAKTDNQTSAVDNPPPAPPKDEVKS